MTVLSTLFENWAAVEAKIEEVIGELRAEGLVSNFEPRLKEKLGDEYPNHWFEKIIGPIASQIKEFGKFEEVKVLGPFGVGARVSLHCYKNSNDDIADIKSITFEPDLDRDAPSPLKYVDYNSDTQRYAKGTVGEVNGLNYEAIHVNPDTCNEAWLGLLD